ncbi:protein kinase domain-containing protein [Tundrisphaera sp. TA3]|uniref:serine/threonine-protein kinase n=1 Tax=Tundrisphaera sp. TA3 TaxID=3435775 RepID=UPI003EC12FF0
MDPSVAEVLALLRGSRAVDVSRDGPATGDADHDPSADLIGRLGGLGLLTGYQAGRIRAGCGHELVIGPYLLLDPRGAGGMGRVFRAWHPAMGREVALKILLDGHRERASVVQRFRDEALAAGKLAHPNVVVAHDAGEVDDLAYFVMEFVSGIDLEALVRGSGPLAVGPACDAARQAALGLQHIHERGLVHRDINPSNLLMADDGVVKVADLGLARASDGVGPGGMLDDRIVGTPDFLAPEASEDPAGADIRADIYSLGCTLYFLLAGAPPYPGGTALGKVGKHRDALPIPLDALRSDLPPALVAVIRRMMARWPGDRFAAPEEVARALGPFSGGPTAPELPPSDAALRALIEEPRWGGRRVAGSILLLAIAAGGIAAWRHAARRDGQGAGAVRSAPPAPGTPAPIDGRPDAPPRSPSPSGSADRPARNLARKASVRGWERIRDNDYDRAYAEFDEAIRLDPANVRALDGRGVCLQRRGECERAIADFTQAIRLEPGSAKYHADRGSAYRQAGNLAGAAADYERAIALGPRIGNMHRALGLIRLDLGELDRALDCLDRAIELDPADLNAYRARSRVHKRMGNIEAYEADRRRAIGVRSWREGT